MNIETKGKKFILEIESSDIKNMAQAIQQDLIEVGHTVSLEVCLDIVCKKIGFSSYSELLEHYENLDYECNRSNLIHNWIKDFLALGFKEWVITTIEDTEWGELFKYEILGENTGVLPDLDSVYEHMWIVLSELIYCEVSLYSNSDIFKHKTKTEIEKNILTNTLPTNLGIQTLLEKIHNHINKIPKILRQEFVNNSIFYYLQSKIENRSIYQRL